MNNAIRRYDTYSMPITRTANLRAKFEVSSLTRYEDNNEAKYLRT